MGKARPVGLSGVSTATTPVRSFTAARISSCGSVPPLVLDGDEIAPGHARARRHHLEGGGRKDHFLARREEGAEDAVDGVVAAGGGQDVGGFGAEVGRVGGFEGCGVGVFAQQGGAMALEDFEAGAAGRLALVHAEVDDVAHGTICCGSETTRSVPPRALMSRRSAGSAVRGTAARTA